jgi:protein ImuA
VSVPPSTFPSVARNRAAVMEELRRLLPGMQGFHTTLPFGLAALDSFLPDGGLACGALHEVVPEAQAAIPAALGFIAAVLSRTACAADSLPRCGEGVGVERRRAVLDALSCPPRGLHAGPRQFDPDGRRIFFIMPAYGLREYGRLYGHGLNALGLDPARVILVETAPRKQILWAMEEALRSRAPAAVAGMIDKLDLKTSQRLHLTATECGLPLLLLRPLQNLESSAAATRWRVGTAEAARDRFGLITRPRWHLRLERCRNGRPGEWLVEYDHVAHRFSLAATLADTAHARGAGEKAVRKAHCA